MLSVKLYQLLTKIYFLFTLFANIPRFGKDRANTRAIFMLKKNGPRLMFSSTESSLKLETRWRELVRDYRDKVSDYTKFLHFLDNKGCSIIRSKDFDLSEYGKNVTYPSNLRRADSEVIEEIAILIRDCEKKKDGNDTENRERGGYLNRFERDAHGRNNGFNLEEPKHRLHFNRQLELMKRGAFELASPAQRRMENLERDMAAQEHRQAPPRICIGAGFANRNRFGETSNYPNAPWNINAEYPVDHRGVKKTINRFDEHRDCCPKAPGNINAEYPIRRNTRRFAENTEPFSSRFGKAFEDENYGNAFGEGCYGGPSEYFDGYGREDYRAEKSNFGNCGSDYVRDLSDVEGSFYGDYSDEFTNQIQQAKKHIMETKKSTNEAVERKTEKKQENTNKERFVSTRQTELILREALSILNDPQNYENYYGCGATKQIHPIAQLEKDREAIKFAKQKADEEYARQMQSKLVMQHANTEEAAKFAQQKADEEYARQLQKEVETNEKRREATDFKLTQELKERAFARDNDVSQAGANAQPKAIPPIIHVPGVYHPRAQRAHERTADDYEEMWRNYIKEAREPATAYENETINSEKCRFYADELCKCRSAPKEAETTTTTNPETLFKATTEFGQFEVASAELADAITWLNEPANEQTIKNAVKRSGLNRANDIEKLIMNKIVLQEEYFVSWSKKNTAPKTLDEINFLEMRGVKPTVLMPVKTEQTPTLPKSREATTLYGPIKTNTIEEAVAISFLSSEDNFEKILEAEKKISKGEKLSYEERSIEEKLNSQEEFIRQWKIDNLGKPVSRLTMSEMTWIVSKEEHFDEMHQKRQAKQFEAPKEKRATIKFVDCTVLVDTKHGTIAVKDPKVSSILGWMSENDGLCKAIKNRLALGSRGALDLKVQEFFEVQKKFLEQYKKDNLVKRNPDFNLFNYCKKEQDALNNEKYIGEKFKNLPGAPTDPFERNIVLTILRMEKNKRKNWAGHWASMTDSSNIRTRDTKTAAAISWLDQFENKSTIAEVRRKQAANLKLGDIDQAIIKKINLEKEFVKEWRTQDFVDRTDFELTALVPAEFAYIQRKEAEYENRNNIETNRVELISTDVAGSSGQTEDLVLSSENLTSPAASSDAFNVPTMETLFGDNESEASETSTIEEIEPTEAGVEEVVEDSTDNGFEPAELSPSTSSFDLVDGTGTRTEQLTRMLADLLANLESSNPAEYQTKEEEILNPLGN